MMKKIAILFFVLIFQGIALSSRVFSCDVPENRSSSETASRQNTRLPETALKDTLADGRRQNDTLINMKKFSLGGTETIPFVKPAKEKKPHSPKKATIMAMILPGSGQVYNEELWKLPIYYGGMGAAIYGLTWNNKTYKKYREAFVAITQYLNYVSEHPDETVEYPEENGWDHLFRPGQTAKGREAWFQGVVMNRKNRYKRDRDLMYIVTGAVYLFQVLDATVFAHFYDYEINEDLSMRIKPSGDFRPGTGGNLGMTLTLTF